MAYYIPDKVYAAIGELIRKGRMQLADPGFPDLFLLHPRWNQRFYAELKSESGDLTDAQRQWRDALLEAGEEWHCWRPRHWDDLILPRLQGVELDSTPSAGMEGEWVPPQFARFLRRRTAAASPSGGSTSPDRGARRR